MAVSIHSLVSRGTTVRLAFDFRYLLYLPDGYNLRAVKGWPLVAFFHGRGERGDDLNLLLRHGLPKLVSEGKKFPFILLAPQCPAENDWWNYVALEALVETMVRRHRVDRDRVYLTGLSMGGFATWALAQQAPERYAAIAPICGGGDVRHAPRLSRLPVWAVHGTRDTAVPVGRTWEMVRAIRAAGGRPRLTIHPRGGHDVWTRTYEKPEFYTWLLAQKRTSARGAKI